MFKMAREMFSAAELAQFDEQYEDWKQSDAASALVAMEKTKAGVKGVVKSVMQ